MPDVVFLALNKGKKEKKNIMINNSGALKLPEKKDLFKELKIRNFCETIFFLLF